MEKRAVMAWGIVRVVAAVLLVVWLVLHLRRWDPRFAMAPPRWAQPLGALLMVAGGVLVLLCGAILSTRGILEQPGARLTPKELAGSGPFQYLRNPMSLGVVTLFLGLGLWLRSISILLFALGLFLFLHLAVVYVEEPLLEARFGSVYLKYKNSVNRWLPFCKPHP